MPLSWTLPVLVVAALSWLLSVWLAFGLWRSADSVFVKLGYSLLLLVPLMGPVFFVWIRNIPDSNHPELIDYYKSSGDVLDRWRSRLEKAGKLPKLQQHWLKGRRK